jgi:hypothetical protein
MARRTVDPLALRPPPADPMAEWRAAAKAVTRAWNAWLAAGPAERAAAHDAYDAALRAEARAAARAAEAA